MTGVLRASLMALVMAIGPAARAQNFTLTEQQFNSWLGNSNTSPEAAITAQIATKIRALKDACRLTPNQIDKLEMAGGADVARFRTQVEVLRHELVGKTYTDNEINEVYQRISPLRQQMQAGIIGKQSLFMKVMNTSLQAPQRDEFERIEELRAADRYRAKVRLYVAALDSASAMTAKQRDGLLEILFAETRPPTKFGQYDWYYIQSQASKIPEDRFAKLLDEAQVNILKQSLQQGRQMDRFLEQQGIEPRKEPLSKKSENNDKEPPMADPAHGAADHLQDILDMWEFKESVAAAAVHANAQPAKDSE